MGDGASEWGLKMVLKKAPSEPRHARQSLRACERWCWREFCCCPHKGVCDGLEGKGA